jgi:DNA-binding MarR family transcriptional regulator
MSGEFSQIIAEDATLTFNDLHGAPRTALDQGATEFRRSITRMARLFSAGMPKGELTPIRLSALGILRRDGPMTASMLASRLGIRPQSMTRILAELEGGGMLTRSRGPNDTREHILDVTPKAVELMREEGIRRDESMRTAMRSVLTPVEIDLLILATKTINKLADGWDGAEIKARKI